MAEAMTNLTTFRAAAIQDSSVWLDRSASTEKACALIEEAGRGGADVVLSRRASFPAFRTGSS